MTEKKQIKDLRMKMEYTPPTFQASSFNCPHCRALAGMKWQQLLESSDKYVPVYLSTCHACRKPSVWVQTSSLRPPNVALSISEIATLQGPKIVFPEASQAPMAEPDMPNIIVDDYEEARAIFKHSPRASAALLRLCVQKLCQHLLGKEGSIHALIGELVDKGLPERVLKALDTIRIFGNESVHPGRLNLNDTPEVALGLFTLLNISVRYCITEERDLEVIRALTPPNKRRDI